MIRTYLLAGRENWICDRFVDEWNDSGLTYFLHRPTYADALWLVAGWCWNQVDPSYLASKPVIVTQHHIVPDKFDEVAWNLRDQFVDAYHVPCEKTRGQVAQHTSKPIYVIPFWANQHLWYPLDMNQSRADLGLPEDACLVGSFQRDTEGSDLASPKLEKGPDIFCDIMEKMKVTHENLHVVLAGWRRQYVIGRLEAAGIPYTYLELPDAGVLNTLYNVLDLYIVSARHEGGPQAIVECALTKTPIISTDVGMAGDLLARESIYFSERNYDVAKPNTDVAYENVRKLMIPEGMKPFKAMLEEVAAG